MNDLWLRVCSLLNVDPATVKQPAIKEASPVIADLFGGWSCVYHPGDNMILTSGNYDSGHIAHEFAHAVCWQSPDYSDADNEARAQWVEQNI